jgi:hypothetical protein
MELSTYVSYDFVGDLKEGFYIGPIKDGNLNKWPPKGKLF